MRASPWTPERDATLREMFEAGFPDREIAKTLGISRGSVIGRRFRLSILREAVRTRGLVRDKAGAVVIPARAVTQRAPLSRGVNVGCKWIEKAAPPFFADGSPYCGATVATVGGSWCAEHQARVFAGFSQRHREVAA